jgi:hypothetical protein
VRVFTSPAAAAAEQQSRFEGLAGMLLVELQCCCYILYVALLQQWKVLPSYTQAGQIKAWPAFLPPAVWQN